MADITITVTRSAGTDGAILVILDTTFEPTGSEPGLRVLLNDQDIFTGPKLKNVMHLRKATEWTYELDLADLPYQ